MEASAIAILLLYLVRELQYSIAIGPAQCDLRVGDDASISTALGRPPPTALGSCSQKISRGPIELADACARADSEFGRLQAAGWPNFWRKTSGRKTVLVLSSFHPNSAAFC